MLESTFHEPGRSPTLLISRLDRDEERRFLEHILEWSGGKGANKEAYAIFCAIQSAMTPAGVGGGETAIAHGLVANLAACAQVAMNYDKGVYMPMIEADHDFVLSKTFNGFVRTCVVAVRNAGDKPSLYSKNEAGEHRVGCFTLPGWFPEWAMTWTW